MDNFLSSKQVSEMLGVHVRTVQRLTNQGKIKAIKIGKLFKYNKKDIEQYLLQGIDFSKEPIRKLHDFHERRTNPRINCFLQCYIKVIIPQKKEISTMARILNINEGGIFLENCDNEEEFINIRSDDPINLKFELNERNKLELDARVVRIQNKRLAVKFKNLNQNVREVIKEYVG